MQVDLGMDPLLSPCLGSGTFPLNLSLLLASITLNFSVEIFLSIKFLSLTRLMFSSAL